MKIRIRFSKKGPVKFIGHLDILRYFQKAFRRAEFDLVYSQGYHPHPVQSFASPLGVGLESEGEYMDIELNSMDSPEQMLERLNAQMSEGIMTTGFTVLRDDAKNSMSILAGADYKVRFREGYMPCPPEELSEMIRAFLALDEIPVQKKTKKNELTIDIRPMIRSISMQEDGSIFMPALRLSKELELTENDKKLGITVKIKILEPDTERTAMGIVADTFRKMPDTYTGRDVISTSGWGKHGKEALTSGLDYAIHNDGKALLLGVDIYKLTAMHYIETITPDDINAQFAPSDEINRIYPPDEWFIEAGHPPVKAWYKIQAMAYEKGFIKEMYIGDCKAMFFDIWSVVSLYENELRNDPYGLWGMKRI